jgi:hypothetical protein
MLLTKKTDSKAGIMQLKISSSDNDIELALTLTELSDGSSYSIGYDEVTKGLLQLKISRHLIEGQR